MRTRQRCKICNKTYYINYAYRPDKGEKYHRHKSCCPACMPTLLNALTELAIQTDRRINIGSLIPLHAPGTFRVRQRRKTESQHGKNN